ncbi:hypothetical protein [Sorangium sp. So ce1182]|uniref:hypothetical protein n=1 Tax=Sorangium sp. So ce1182 TaxID=3133334 RepID=UPI003F5F7525
MDDATRKPITFRDLRATGVTWMAIRGDEPLKIMGQASHAAFVATQRYVREAEQLAGRFEAVFPPLPASLLGDDGHDDPSGNRQDDAETPKNEANVSPFQEGGKSRDVSCVNQRVRRGCTMGRPLRGA